MPIETMPIEITPTGLAIVICVLSYVLVMIRVGWR